MCGTSLNSAASAEPRRAGSAPHSRSTSRGQPFSSQLASIGGSATAHDAKGNLTTDPTSGKTYGYSSENLLKTATGGVTLAYDPMLRLYDVTGAATTRFAYDGLDRIAEYDGGSALLRRYVHGPGMDEPLVWYEGTGTTDRRFLSSDERGSIISVTDSAGALLGINRYDEYGLPQSTNLGKWGYTGQAWLPEIGVQYSKARIYSPTLGRFLQTDPIDILGGINLYAYVLNDPVNYIDPLGLQSCDADDCIPGKRRRLPSTTSAGVPMIFIARNNPSGGEGGGEEIIVTAQRKHPGKPSQCLTQAYRAGEELDDLGLFIQRAAVLGGIPATILGSAEGMGIATALVAVRFYGFGTAIRVAGTALKSDPRASVQEVTMQLMGSIVGADPISKWVGGQIVDAVASQVSGQDPCKI